MINPAFFKTPDSARAVELSLQKRGLDFQKVSEISPYQAKEAL